MLVEEVGFGHAAVFSLILLASFVPLRCRSVSGNFASRQFQPEAVTRQARDQFAVFRFCYPVEKNVLDAHMVVKIF
jgi:hypothetical protein